MAKRLDRARSQRSAAKAIPTTSLAFKDSMNLCPFIAPLHVKVQILSARYDTIARSSETGRSLRRRLQSDHKVICWVSETQFDQSNTWYWWKGPYSKRLYGSISWEARIFRPPWCARKARIWSPQVSPQAPASFVQGFIVMVTHREMGHMMVHQPGGKISSSPGERMKLSGWQSRTFADRITLLAYALFLWTVATFAACVSFYSNKYVQISHLEMLLLNNQCSHVSVPQQLRPIAT